MDINAKIQLYKENRINNKDIDWQEYIKINNDLNFLKINAKAIDHWMKHGKKEPRKYNENNLELTNVWPDINRYLNTNSYQHTSFAFIITTCVRENVHLNYLKESIQSIRNFYPETLIYIINDNSNKEYNINEELNKFSHIEIISSIANKGGEINPYLFILDSRCKHDKLIYIHDTVFLKSNIDDYINTKNEILFFWYSIFCKFNDTINKIDNKDIYDNLYLYFGNSKIKISDYLLIIKDYFSFDVKFGSMSIFTKRFMEKVNLVTNFLECSHYFTKRIHRCFFERILSIFYIFIYNQDYPLSKFICGDINQHPDPFTNTNSNLQIFIKKKKTITKITYGPLVKVWQGR